MADYRQGWVHTIGVAICLRCYPKVCSDRQNVLRQPGSRKIRVFVAAAAAGRCESVALRRSSWIMRARGRFYWKWRLNFVPIGHTSLTAVPSRRVTRLSGTPLWSETACWRVTWSQPMDVPRQPNSSIPEQNEGNVKTKTALMWIFVRASESQQKSSVSDNKD
jgi:hypothetical protein